MDIPLSDFLCMSPRTFILYMRGYEERQGFEITKLAQQAIWQLAPWTKSDSKITAAELAGVSDNGEGDDSKHLTGKERVKYENDKIDEIFATPPSTDAASSELAQLINRGKVVTNG